MKIQRNTYRKGSVFTTDPCLYLVKFSLDVLKTKTKVLDIFNMGKKCFMKINIESSLPEIWIRIPITDINNISDGDPYPYL